MLIECLKRKSFPSPLLIEGRELSGILLDYKRFALCETQTACGDCRSCKQVLKAFHPDLLEAKGDLKMEELRSLLHRLRQKPLQSKARLLCLTEFQMASKQVQNALLKTLEEPLESWLIVLSTQSAGKALPTLRSRCLVFRMGSEESEAKAPLSELEAEIFELIQEERDWVLQQKIESCLKKREQSRSVFSRLLQKASEKNYPGHWLYLSEPLLEAIEQLDRNLNPKTCWEFAWTRSLQEAKKLRFSGRRLSL
ncbi:MAG: hypothetical protein EA369_05775 [Bradymonadales bacterium]|nr:MAG: hypothetical protein EA369_05775 [Bradymonadales bacterium]